MVVFILCIEEKTGYLHVYGACDLGLHFNLNRRLYSDLIDKRQKYFCVNWLFIWDLRFRGEAPSPLLLYFSLPLTSVAEQKKKKGKG